MNIATAEHQCSITKKDSRGCVMRGVHITCKHCGVVFETRKSRSHQQYCSVRCKNVHTQRTHGESRTRLYGIWTQMNHRCHSPIHLRFPLYGARGIRVCDEWRNSFEAFRDWSLANGYGSDLEIDRRENDGNYDPSNCRWVTHAQNLANMKKQRTKITTSRFKGVCQDKCRIHCTKKWKAQCNQGGKRRHIGMFLTSLQAAIAYDDAAYELRGEFALLNFPERKRGIASGNRR